MNRLSSTFALSTDDVSIDRPPIDVSAGVYSRPATDDVAAFFAPMHYEPGYAYPLIVWLHGGGDDEGQLKRIMPLVSMRNFVGAAVRGTLPTRSKQGRTGYTWSQSPAQIAAAEQRVFGAIDAAVDRFHVAPQRIFLAGRDCGGTMAFRLAMVHPDRFAGVVSIGGPFPDGGAPLSQLAAVRNVPLLIVRGRDGGRYPSPIACNDLRLFHVAGMDVSMREYPGGDQLSPQMLADVNRWVMDQIAAPSQTT